MAKTIGEIKIDMPAFNKVMDKLSDRYRVEASQVLWDQHRLYTEDLIKGTPPRTLAIGRKAIDKDLDKIFISLNKQDVLDWYAEQFGNKTKSIGKGVRSAIRGRLQGEGVFFNWNGDKNRMRGYHEGLRKGRNKGVKFKSHDVVISDNLKFGTGMYVNKSKISSYKKDRKKSVGKLKAGWAKAAIHYGAFVPGFVMKQAVKMGSFQDKVNKKEVNISLTSINSIPWASRKLTDLMTFATRKRQTDLDKHLKRAVERVAKKWSSSKNG